MFLIFKSSKESSKNNRENDPNDNTLTNWDTSTHNRKHASDNELSTKKYVDDELGKKNYSKVKSNIRKLSQVSVGNHVYNLTKYDRIQITDVTEIKSPNIGTDLLQKWKIISNNKNGDTKIGNFS